MTATRYAEVKRQQYKTYGGVAFGIVLFTAQAEEAWELLTAPEVHAMDTHFTV